MQYVVPGIVPEGLTLLVAAPKVGKSWMVLGMAAAAARGGRALGSIPVAQRPVLYLALEDGPRRLQDRMRVLGELSECPNLLFITKLEASVMATISTYLERYGDQQPLVILDTLGKVRGRDGGNDQYGRDYSQMGALKELFDSFPGSALIVVHHTNKGGREDFLESVSGTQGLAGAADTILLIQRERNSQEATLHVTSRDAAEGKYALVQENGTTWRLDGKGLQEASDKATLHAVTGGVGDLMAQVIQVVSRNPEGIKAADVATLLGEDPETVRKYLTRAYSQNRLSKRGRGLYAPVPSVPSVPTEKENGTHGTHGTPFLKVVSNDD